MSDPLEQHDKKMSLIRDLSPEQWREYQRIKAKAYRTEADFHRLMAEAERFIGNKDMAEHNEKMAQDYVNMANSCRTE